MENCKICDKSFKNIKAVIAHVNFYHKITSKEYYDVYFKKEGEGECEVCGNTTTYRGVSVGYLNNCSAKCRDNNKNIKRDSWLGKTQSKEHIEKRIKNTNQQEKESTRKNTMISKYGVDNPTKIKEVKEIVSKKLTGQKRHRTEEWQKNIIEAKRKNGTLKHTDATKKKISEILNKHYDQNLDREPCVKNSINVNHMYGWYKNLFFRSSLELSFLINNSEQNFLSCENKKYGVLYVDDGRKRVYYPDFTDGVFIYEIKPSTMISLYNNQTKIAEAKKKYGDKYILITEKESPYVNKQIIIDLINSGDIILPDKVYNKLDKYKY